MAQKQQCSDKNLGFKIFRSQLPEENDYYSYDSEKNIYNLKGEYSATKLDSSQAIEQEYVLGDELCTKVQQQKIYEEAKKIFNEEENSDFELKLQECVDVQFEFYNRVINKVPDQIIRYSFHESSEPLFYSKHKQFDPKKVPKCSNCGAARQFEFQLSNDVLTYFPSLIELNWGILAIYSCSKSCDSENMLREVIMVQQSPDDIDMQMQEKRDKIMMAEFKADMNDETTGIEDLSSMSQVSDTQNQTNEEFIAEMQKKELEKKNNGGEISENKIEVKKDEPLFGGGDDDGEGDGDSDDWD